MNKYDRAQAKAKADCIKLILDDETHCMEFVRDILACLIEEYPKDVNRAAHITIINSVARRLSAEELDFLVLCAQSVNPDIRKRKEGNNAS